MDDVQESAQVRSHGAVAEPASATESSPGPASWRAAEASSGSVAAMASAHFRPDHHPALNSTSLVELLDELDTGVMVCDVRGQLLLANEPARRELALGGVLQLGGDGALGVHGGASLLVLRRAVQAAASDQRHQLVSLRAQDRSLMVAVQPMRGLPAGMRCAVLLLGRRQLCAELAVQRLGVLYELTDAEQEVLTSLLAGTPVRELARQRGVAMCTVRTQVASLRAKFGVNRLLDLARLAAELPPMVGALHQSSGMPSPLR